MTHPAIEALVKEFPLTDADQKVVLDTIEALNCPIGGLTMGYVLVSDTLVIQKRMGLRFSDGGTSHVSIWVDAQRRTDDVLRTYKQGLSYVNVYTID